MIDNSLSTVANELSQYLKTKLSLSTDRAIVSDILTAEPDDDSGGFLYMTLINIEEDKTATQKHTPSQKVVYLDLYVLLSAYFAPGENVNALKFISTAISFFGNKPEFNTENTPGLDPAMKELTFEIRNLTFAEQADMWRSLGVRSRPSVLYKVYGVHVPLV
jgi:hypothetical protein